LPVTSVEELLELFEQMKIGIPRIVYQDEHTMRVAIDDCFCKGVPVLEEKMVCDLEGAIMEGALNKMMGHRVTVKETRCNVNGDEHCEYEIRFLK